MEDTNKCIVEGCTRDQKSLKMCHMHYKRFKRNGHSGLQYRHGLSKTPEYSVWETMKSRCYNSNVASFKYYGAKGITVCGRWLNSVENFYSDMGKRPSQRHDIDRIDSTGNYEPSNCRWATKTENSRNRLCVKMNIDKAREVRQKRTDNQESFRNLAKEYNVTHKTIMLICQNKIWKENV